MNDSDIHDTATLAPTARFDAPPAPPALPASTPPVPAAPAAPQQLRPAAPPATAPATVPASPAPAVAAPPAASTPAAPSAGAARVAGNGNGGAAIAPSRRKPLLIAILVVVLLAGAAYGIYWALVLNHFEGTDNAYVQGPVVQITPQVGGTVDAILADDTDMVAVGQPLVRLDPSDARLALDRAEAQLGATVREVRSLFTNNDVIGAQIRLRQADVARAQAEVDRASDDVKRRQPLVQSGAVGSEEMQHAQAALAVARTALTGAQSAVAAARQQENGSRTMTEGTTVERHPNVLRAAGAVREAYLALQRTELPSPVAGQVAKRTVEVGQRIAAGTPLMSVIPLEQVWVEANFKEVQLRRMRIGQPVTLHADLYGGKVDYHGHIAGLGAGTGAAFALLPAQNATGNWIKVVQRVPVRIEIDPKDLTAHPLRVGLSMEAEVDIADQSGRPVGDPGAAPHGNVRTNVRTNATDVFAAQQAAADRVVQQVIDENMGRAPAAAGKPTAALRHGARPVAAGLLLDRG